VFELTPEGSETMGPDEMVDLLAGAGYAGIDLGPLGFLGRGPQLRRRLERAGLEIAGGWIQLPMSDDEAFHASLPTLRATLQAFSDASESGPRRLPLPTLADDGSLARRTHPGRGQYVDPLNDDGWHRLFANAERAAALVRQAGFEPTFHHHAGTFVESPEEIDRFLANVDIDLTLDTGHLCIAGGDPLDAVSRWGRRINHLHLKDVNTDELRAVIADGGGMREVWTAGVFTVFGSGGVDIQKIMSAVDDLDYDGWIVVEQDVLNGPGVSLADFSAQRAADQQQNREALRPWA
jgi:inosose dehydratase